jgi:pyruvate formate lyase activating enzyme
MDRLMDRAQPQAIAQEAKRLACKSVAFTYNDPVVFFEYALDAVDACHELGLKTVAVTAGYLHDALRREFFAKMDAANIDLKGFSVAFYLKLTGAHLQPVLDTLAYVHHETDCWLEVTTLLIPGYNDSDAEITALTKWLAEELGQGIPLHFSAFHPDWKMTNVPPTPSATLSRVRRIALDAGLHHVYTGNVHDIDGGTTRCASCHKALIVRDWFQINEYHLLPNGSCPSCRARLAGHFEQFELPSGRQIIPVIMGKT